MFNPFLGQFSLRSEGRYDPFKKEDDQGGDPEYDFIFFHCFFFLWLILPVAFSYRFVLVSPNMILYYFNDSVYFLKLSRIFCHPVFCISSEFWVSASKVSTISVWLPLALKCISTF